MSVQKILIIQTAFLGDVILATSAIESLHAALPEAEIHFLLRKGNESLLEGHPHLTRCLVLDKGKKWEAVRVMIREMRKEKYDLVLNFQRFLTSGILAVFSGGRVVRGFRKNPLSLLFSRRYPHEILKNGKQHEIERNHLLYADLAPELLPPRLYPLGKHEAELPATDGPFITIAPASVWFTKQWPSQQWASFLNSIRQPLTVCLLGAPGDAETADEVLSQTNNKNLNIFDLTGKLSLLASAALMKNAEMNYVNDSAPLHLASAVNAPVTAVFCSTVPGFGFTPLSDDSQVIQVEEELSCRPCGLHGHRACPEGHFKCALDIQPQRLAARLS